MAYQAWFYEGKHRRAKELQAIWGCSMSWAITKANKTLKWIYVYPKGL